MTAMPTLPATETLRVLMSAVRLGADGFAGYPSGLLAAASPLSRFLPPDESRGFANEVARRLIRADAASAPGCRSCATEGAEPAMELKV